MRTDYFPWGIAKGKAFFDREEETKRLLDNIKNAKHTLLISPRRYGKSSLAKRAIALTRLPYAEIDFFLVVDDASIEYRVIKGVRALIQQVSDTPEQWFNTLRNFFGKIKKKWTIGIKGLSLELTPDDHSDIADNILNALNALEHILMKKKQKAVFFVDEFQEITKSPAGEAIEGAIRHFAQESKYLSFIFSGSSRHLLSRMFSDHERPLYRLCDRITLGRINEVYYQKYLNAVAEKTWDESIKEDVFAAITRLTECHPNYLYVLCSYVWRNFPDEQPNADQVVACWQNYIHELLKETRTELSKLNIGQLKVLIMIGLGTYTELTGKKAQKKLSITSGAIVYALRALEDMDYIERYDQYSFRIISPVIRHTLEMFYKEE
jgi:hypothetical protein